MTVVGFVWYKNKSLSSCLIQTILMACAFTATWIVVVTIIFGSPLEYYDVLKAESLNAHSLGNLIWTYIWWSSRILPYILIGLGAFALVHYLLKMRLPKPYTILIIIALAGLYLLNLRVVNASSNCNQIWFLCTGFFFTVLALIWYKNRAVHDNMTSVLLLVCLGISLMPISGSNTGFNKHLTAILFPVLAAYGYKYISRAFIVYGIVFLGVLGIYGPINRTSSMFFHPGTKGSTETVENRLFAGVKTTAEISERIKEISDVVETHKGYIYTVGDKPTRYIIDYIIGARTPVFRNDWEGNLLDNPSYASEIKKLIVDNNETVTIIFRKGDSNSVTITEKTLEETNPCKVTDLKYIKVFEFEPSHTN